MIAGWEGYLELAVKPASKDTYFWLRIGSDARTTIGEPAHASVDHFYLFTMSTSIQTLSTMDAQDLRVPYDTDDGCGHANDACLRFFK